MPFSAPKYVFFIFSIKNWGVKHELFPLMVYKYQRLFLAFDYNVNDDRKWYQVNELGYGWCTKEISTCLKVSNISCNVLLREVTDGTLFQICVSSVAGLPDETFKGGEGDFICKTNLVSPSLSCPRMCKCQDCVQSVRDLDTAVLYPGSPIRAPWLDMEGKWPWLWNPYHGLRVLGVVTTC